MKKVGIFIGRFQPFHNEHKRIIDLMEQEMDFSLVLVGSSDRHLSYKNPFDYTDIRDMILNSCFSANVFPIGDYIFDDDLWAKEVKKFVDYIVDYEFQNPDDVQYYLYGHKKDESSFYLELFPEWDLKLVESKHDMLHSTNIRNSIAESSSFYEFKDTWDEYIPVSTLNVIKQKYDSVKEIITQDLKYIKNEKKKFECYPYPTTLNFITVDFVLILNNEVLCIQRKFTPGKDSFAVPGGFLENNESSIDGAIRELKEETGIDITKYVDKSNINSFVADKPNRSLYGRRLSIVYCCKIKDESQIKEIKQIASANDDAKSIEFIPMEDILDINYKYGLVKFFDDHRELIILSYFAK